MAFVRKSGQIFLRRGSCDRTILLCSFWQLITDPASKNNVALFLSNLTKINGIWLQDVIFQNTGLKIGLNATFNNTNLHYCRVYKRTSLPEYTDAVSIPEFTRIKYATRAIEIATTLLIKTIFILISPCVNQSALTSRS